MGDATYARDSLVGRHTPGNLQRVWNRLQALELRHFSLYVRWPEAVMQRRLRELESKRYWGREAVREGNLNS